MQATVANGDHGVLPRMARMIADGSSPVRARLDYFREAPNSQAIDLTGGRRGSREDSDTVFFTTDCADNTDGRSQDSRAISPSVSVTSVWSAVKILSSGVCPFDARCRGSDRSLFPPV